MGRSGRVLGVAQTTLEIFIYFDFPLSCYWLLGDGLWWVTVGVGGGGDGDLGGGGDFFSGPRGSRGWPHWAAVENVLTNSEPLPASRTAELRRIFLQTSPSAFRSFVVSTCCADMLPDSRIVVKTDISLFSASNLWRLKLSEKT